MQKHPPIISSTQPVLGLDVAHTEVVAALRCDAQRVAVATFANHAGGFRRLRTWLHQHFAGRVRAGLEASGTCSYPLARWLHEAGHVVHLLNPARVAAYGRSCGQRNKTDPADARNIAAFVATHDLPAWTPPPPEQKTLQELCRVRHQLTTQRQQLKNQLRTASAVVQAHFTRLIAACDAELDALAAALTAHLAAHPALGAQVRRLATVPGVGELTAAVVVAELPPITAQSDPRALAAWCGLTPVRSQSGQTERRTRLSRAGNVHLRQALHMPALVAKRYNPLLKAFAARLAQRGKRPGAILGAVAHKLLRLLIGLLRHQQDFDPSWSPQRI